MTGPVALLVLLTLAALPRALRVRPRAPLVAGARRSRAGHRSADPPVVDAAVLLDLAAAALDAGVSVPGALIALGEAVGGRDGERLRRAGASLLLGAGWPTAWRRANGGPLGVLADTLEPAWTAGVPAGPLLACAADRIRAERARQAHEAAARLGVRLVLPLGLCLLPAFVLLGLVPVLIATGGGLFG